MEGNVVSIAFLLLMLIVPLAIIISIILLIVSRRSGIKGVVSLADSRGWSYQTSSEHHPLLTYLGEDFFAHRDGEHSLDNILSISPRFWVAHYHFKTEGLPGSGRSSDTVLAVLARTKPGPVCWMIHNSNPFLKDLATSASSLSEVPGVSWLLCSSLDNFKTFSWGSEEISILKKNLMAGAVLYLSKDFIIMSSPGRFKSKHVVRLVAGIQEIQKLLSR